MAKSEKTTEMSNINGEKLKALKLTMDKIEKDYGKGSVMMMNERSEILQEVISTGSIGLDVALGIGGLPRGRVVEIYGPESSGKTTIATHVIAEAQKKSGMCAFIDAGKNRSDVWKPGNYHRGQRIEILCFGSPGHTSHGAGKRW